MYKFNINHIIIIDCLHSNDMQTARKLEEDINDFLNSNHNQKTNKIALKIIKCNDKTSLISNLQQINNSCINNNIRPLLHFESHASDDFLTVNVPTNELHNPKEDNLITWRELYNKLSNINLNTKNTLLIHFAACLSDAIYDHVDLFMPCPAYAILAATKEVTTRTIQKGYYELYKKLIETGEYKKALDNFSLSVEYQSFSYNVAHDIFRRGFIQLIKGYADPDKYPKVLDILVNRAIKETGKKENELRYVIKENMIKPIYPFAEKVKLKFLMLDKFPDKELEDLLNLKEIEEHTRSQCLSN